MLWRRPNLQHGTVLGHGSFGRVALHKEGAACFALKSIPQKKEKKENKEKKEKKEKTEKKEKKENKEKKEKKE